MNTPENTPEESSASSGLLAVRACNQASKMGGIIERVMAHTARYAATADEGMQRQFAYSALGLIEVMGNAMNDRDMTDHEDLEGVSSLLKELHDYIG